MAPCKSVILTEGLPWVKNIKSNQSNQIIISPFDILHYVFVEINFAMF